MGENGKPRLGNVLQSPKYKKDNKVSVEGGIAGGMSGILESAAHNDRLNRFHGSKGYGFSAEQTNDLIDKLHGRDAKILGDNNAKNGADRMVDGKLIQVKYGQNANASIQYAFKGGKYRYYDAKGNPMQLEVPSDQYEKAVQLMRNRIMNGEVPNVTDPDDAAKIVRKGNVTYQQAVKIAKAGTLDSLSFDAVHGAVVSSASFGLSASITYAIALWNGDDAEHALDEALVTGINVGGTAFVTSVISAQLTRTGLNQMLMGPSIKMVKLLPSNVRKTLVNATREGASIYGGAATNNLAKLLRSNMISSGVFVTVLSAPQIVNVFNGKISGQQLFKDISSVAATVGGSAGGATAGAAIGGAVTTAIGTPASTALGAKIGTYVGGFIGGIVAQDGVNKVLDSFIEDDAVRMTKILNDRFVPLAQEYMLNQEELDIVLDDLQQRLTSGELMAMYASNDRNAFADQLITETIEKTTRWRAHIMLPDAEAFMKSIGRVCKSETTIQEQDGNHSIDPVEIGEKLLGKRVPEKAARKAWYVTKQMNLINQQQEFCLRSMAQDEKIFIQKQEQLYEKRNTLKQELLNILEEDN